jgi:lactoylglutathione lyase
MATSDKSAKGPPPGVFLPNGLQTDPPLHADDVTVGIKLNHLCLRVRDLDKALHFYIQLMGMRTVMAFNTGPATMYFLGYPQTEQHRENLPLFGLETAGSLANTHGFLELIHVHGAETQPVADPAERNLPRFGGFDHIAFSVPNLPAMLERLRQNKVEFAKDFGVGGFHNMPAWAGLMVPAAVEASKQAAFVRDPVSLETGRLWWINPDTNT